MVIEDLELTPYGNRVPQFNFEVVRAAQGPAVAQGTTLDTAVRAVALIPGTGEYGLATTPVHYAEAPGRNRSANVHSPSGMTDFATSLDQLDSELPMAGSVSLVVSWFGSDLRCGSCAVRPKVEQKLREGVPMAWRAGGITRAGAEEVPKVEGRSVYGGSPADASVIEAIRAMKAAAKEVMFYPFLLMDQIEDNTLPDPWTGAMGQPKLPWRGRVTLSVAPGREGSPDRSAAAAAEVAAFFGAAEAGHFSVQGETVSYSGPQDWGYRRFILHYARLCAVAGGVEAFCIGSEMRGLTQIRGAGDSFPAVEAFRQLARDVRLILGSETRISYAADWSEYFGLHADGNVYFHLDPLWADPEINFIGIDNYMPISDWREGEDHADAPWGAVHDLDYLKANIAGGEGFDWYYDSPEGAAVQQRLPITDGAFGEDWVFRVKDLRSWWSNLHHDRVAGIRSATPTAWVPGSKPIRFTEYGCAAVDKGTTQPNRFLDPASSESGLPVWSSGRRDDLMQMQYLLAMRAFWTDPANNPQSMLYDGPMVDFDHAHAWAWDARPFPEYPGQVEVWSDGGNYGRGHWLNGRATNQPLAQVVAEICEGSGLAEVDTSGLFGVVRGYQQAEVTSARAALQPLMLTFGFDVIERDGRLAFRNRTGRVDGLVNDDDLVLLPDMNGSFETTRAAEVEISGQVRIGFVDAQSSYESRSTEARFPDEIARGVSQTEMPLALTRPEAQATVERWLSEARLARDAARFALPKSRLGVGAGDVIEYRGLRYRIDRIEQSEAQLIEAVRIEPGIYSAATGEDAIVVRDFVGPVPVLPVFLDLPLLTGVEVPHAPHVAVTADPWPGSVAVWSAVEDAGYELNRMVAAPAVVGFTESILPAAPIGLWDRGVPLRVRLSAGELASASRDAVLNGANVMAVGDGSAGNWEVFQFAEAQLVAPDTYELSLRLRGQAGTDGVMPQEWPIGSTVVLVDLALSQIELPLSARGLARHYRIGSTARGYDDANVVIRVEAFDGIGLRPYPVAHLRASTDAAGTLAASWKRRTRIDGDSWQSAEVPLGEEQEAYLVRIIQGNAVVAEYGIQAPSFAYSTAQRLQDGVGGAWRIAVAQLSQQFGPGPFRVLDVTP